MPHPHIAPHINRVVVLVYCGVSAFLLTPAAAGAAPVLGDQKTIVILANFQNTSQPNETTSDISWELAQVNNFCKENSYGLASVSADVVGWYTLPMDQTRDTLSVYYAAVKAADPDVNFTLYS